MSSPTMTASLTATDPATADRIRELAGEPAMAARRARLLDLADVLAGNAPADTWAHVDLHATLAYPIAPPPARRRPVLHFLNLLRMSLVFAPILVTWWGLFQASSLYREELAAHPDIGAQSFFRLWLGGFDGRLGLSFENMALITVGSIGLLIVTNLLSESALSSDGERAALERLHLMERLGDVLADASLHLARMRPVTPEQFGVELVLTAHRLADLVDKVQAAAAAATEAIRGAESAALASEQTAAVVGQGAAALTQAVSGVSGGIRTAETAITGLLDAMQARDATTATALTGAVAEAAGALDSAVDGLRAAVEYKAAVADENRENIGRLLADHERFLTTVVTDTAGEPRTVHVQALAAQVARLTDTMHAWAAVPATLSPAIDRLAVRLDQFNPYTPPPRRRWLPWR
ncbi:hypothetical protein R8Z50_04320 [Longispora sp. K20-0274]|uniref:hypothetical protein n=1 Tax=Longispora sp. K20-0274 TaxID=3088255 RepID=UPI00399BE76D